MMRPPFSASPISLRRIPGSSMPRPWPPTSPRSTTLGALPRVPRWRSARRLAGQYPGGPCVGRGAAGRRACRIGRWAVAARHLRRDWKGRDFLVSGVCIQIVSERFKCAYVAADNGSGAFEAVVIPSPPVADLESLVATLNAVPDIPLAVVSALSYVHLGSDAKGSNSRHRRPPVLRARRYW